MNTETQSHPTISDDEIDLIDLFVLISENIKPLILLPLAGLLIATILVIFNHQKPKIYTSQSSIFVESPTAKEETPRVRAEVLISAINNGDAFSELRKQGTVTAALGKQDRLVNLTVFAEQPQTAQSVNQAVLNKIFQITELTGDDALRLQKLLANEKQRLSEIRKLIAETSLSPKSSAETIRTYGELLEIASSREFAIAKIQKQLSGLNAGDVVMSPTLPDAPNPTRKALPLLAGLIGGFFIALLWIFIKHALRATQEDPVQQQKWAQIKANLGLKA